jgi:hypothetical protein
MKIVKTEKLPKTTNSWGFGGCTDMLRLTMENGDVWVTGMECYRHSGKKRVTVLTPKEGERREWLRTGLNKLMDKYYGTKKD